MAEEKAKAAEEKKEQGAEYKATDGQTVKLTKEIVKKYLVQGKGDLVSDQEFMFFMHLCRARGLNPYTKECYLIKYSEDPAAIVTSIDFFRKRARAQQDCAGWNVGLITKKQDGSTRKTSGYLPEGDILVGAWFEAKPRGWDVAFYKEVNLKGFIKKTKAGDVTRFWSIDNQPMMIMKIAESQGLRTLWPDEFAKIYTDAEMEPGQPALTGKTEEEEAKEVDAEFEKTYPKDGVNPHKLGEFLYKGAQISGKGITELKKEAIEDPKGFWDAYQKFAGKKDPGGNGGKKCPETGKAQVEDTCKECLFLKGCPARE